MRVVQSRRPSVAESAISSCAPAESPMVKMRPPETATLLRPAPRPVAFQATAGPPGFHDCWRPVSPDAPSRLGPRHCGQSVGVGAAPRDTAAARTQAVATRRPYMDTSARDCASRARAAKVKLRRGPLSNALKVD